MLKVKKVEVFPNKERFGIVHKLTLEGDTEELKQLFEKQNSAQDLIAEGNTLKLIVSPQRVFEFELDKPIEDYYDYDVQSYWKEMTASAMGMEEPFRYYSFFDESGEHIGTVGYKRDCETFLPLVLLYKNFQI